MYFKKKIKMHRLPDVGISGTNVHFVVWVRFLIVISFLGDIFVFILSQIWTI